MSVSELERRLRTILFESRANTVEDIRDAALQAEAGFLSVQIVEQRAQRKATRIEQARERFARGRAVAVARRREQRDLKARAARELRALGLSNPEIAKRLDVSRRQVARLINDEPSADTARCSTCGQVMPAEGSHELPTS